MFLLRRATLTITSVYHLQDRLFILSLDATSLKNAALNLVKAADRMHDEDEELKAASKPPNPGRLISERARHVVQSEKKEVQLTQAIDSCLMIRWDLLPCSVKSFPISLAELKLS
jgi:hypothetical protein